MIDEAQAEVVRRIFRMYLEGWLGLKQTAITLNNERIPPPNAGKRGTGSWSPGAIREMLRNDRYRGVYIHGRIKRVRRGGKRVAVAAAAEDIITIDLPEWRIVDDAPGSLSRRSSPSAFAAPSAPDRERATR